MPRNPKPSGKAGAHPRKRLLGTNAVNFLQKLSPGPWTLTTIAPDGNTTSTRTHTDPEQARKFIAEHNRLGRNIHFQANLCRKGLSSKAGKEDIARVDYLHVDADPKKNETPEQCKQRVQALIQEFQFSPTAIVDSGNGLQLLWRLQPPIKVTSPDVTADVEARNHALAEAFGADPSPRDISRLLRVPGTTNYPNRAKIKLGRVECKARLLKFNDNSYPLNTFPPKVMGTKKIKKTETTPSQRSEIPRQLQALLYHQGPKGESIAGYDSRNELVMAFVTEALRRKVTDACIITACLDSKFTACAIREHCVDNGGQRYVERQITKAREKYVPNHDGNKKYEMVRASAVTIRPPRWLWKGHLLRGAQELLTGIPGLGKSQLQCSFAACVTTGRDFPDGARGVEPGNVIIVTGEDTLDQAVVPRLMAAGADLKRVVFLKAIKQDNKRRPSLPSFQR